MKKKLTIAVICFVIAAGIAFSFTPVKNQFSQKSEAKQAKTSTDEIALVKDMKPSQYDTGVTYQKALKSDVPMMALFYVDWCGYCQRFAPKILDLRKIYDGKMNIVMINCEDPQYKKVAEQYSISGYPTIYIIDPKNDFSLHIQNRIYGDMDKLTAEFDKYLKLREKIK